MMNVTFLKRPWQKAGHYATIVELIENFEYDFITNFLYLYDSF